MRPNSLWARLGDAYRPVAEGVPEVQSADVAPSKGIRGKEMSNLEYVNDIVYTEIVAQIPPIDLDEALTEAQEYLSRAQECESEARSCGRGWQDRINAIQSAIDNLPDDEVDTCSICGEPMPNGNHPRCMALMAP